MADKLTVKQAKFARAYVETGNAAEAYRRSYNAEKMKQKTIWEAACRVLADSKVHAKVEELQERAAERTLVTVASLTQEMDENRRRADELDQAATMQAATMGKAKLHGLLVDKVDHDMQVTVTIAPDDADL